MLDAVRLGGFADRAFDQLAPELTDADRRLAQELAYGVLRLRGRIDHRLDDLVRDGLGSVDARVQDVLRLGAYQLLELDRVPAYAAVSEAVASARRVGGRGAAALVNAVLRRLEREGPAASPFPDPERDPEGYLSTWGSHPRWLVERWCDRWSFDDVRALVEYNNRRPSVYVTVPGARSAAIERLAEAGIPAEPIGIARGSLRVEPGDVRRVLERIDAIVQDPAAAAVIDYAGLDGATDVVDLCAAPGGKATLLAARGHSVVALDIDRDRIDRLLDNRRRLGLRAPAVVVADARRAPVAHAPAVLLDVPCTGTGTLARHPDARWRLGPTDLKNLVELQRELLDAAAKIVAPGGWLVYATCSLEREENAEQVEWFVETHRDYRLEPPTPERMAAPELIGPSGTMEITPQRHGTDGAYAARFRRVHR